MRVQGESGIARPTAHVRRFGCTVYAMARPLSGRVGWRRILDHDIEAIEKTIAVKRLQTLKRLEFQIGRVNTHDTGQNDDRKSM